MDDVTITILSYALLDNNYTIYLGGIVTCNHSYRLLIKTVAYWYTCTSGVGFYLLLYQLWTGWYNTKSGDFRDGFVHISTLWW